MDFLLETMGEDEEKEVTESTMEEQMQEKNIGKDRHLEALASAKDVRRKLLQQGERRKVFFVLFFFSSLSLK